MQELRKVNENERVLIDPEFHLLPTQISNSLSPSSEPLEVPNPSPQILPLTKQQINSRLIRPDLASFNPHYSLLQENKSSLLNTGELGVNNNRLYDKSGSVCGYHERMKDSYGGHYQSLKNLGIGANKVRSGRAPLASLNQLKFKYYSRSPNTDRIDSLPHKIYNKEIMNQTIPKKVSSMGVENDRGAGNQLISESLVDVDSSRLLNKPIIQIDTSFSQMKTLGQQRLMEKKKENHKCTNCIQKDQLIMDQERLLTENGLSLEDEEGLLQSWQTGEKVTMKKYIMELEETIKERDRNIKIYSDLFKHLKGYRHHTKQHRTFIDFMNDFQVLELQNTNLKKENQDLMTKRALPKQNILATGLAKSNSSALIKFPSLGKEKFSVKIYNAKESLFPKRKKKKDHFDQLIEIIEDMNKCLHSLEDIINDHKFITTIEEMHVNQRKVKKGINLKNWEEKNAGGLKGDEYYEVLESLTKSIDVGHKEQEARWNENKRNEMHKGMKDARMMIEDGFQILVETIFALEK